MKLSRISLEWLSVVFLFIILLGLYLHTSISGFSFGLGSIFDFRVFINDLFGGAYFKFLFFIVIAFVLAKFIFIFATYFYRAIIMGGTEKIKSPAEFYAVSKDAINDILMTFLIIGLSLAILSPAIRILFFSADPIKTGLVSEALMEIDLKIFGDYPVFFLQGLSKFPIIEKAIIISYKHLFTIASLLFILLFFSKMKWAFRRLIFSFFICAIISFPFWFMAPAISPQSMYGKNILGTLPGRISPDITANLASIKRSESLTGFIVKADKFWIDESGESLAVSTNPSLHAAWGVVVIFFAFVFSPILGIVLLPWFVMNTLGTVYTFQHYGIDVILGILVGGLALILTDLIFRLEKKYYTGRRNEPFVYEEAKRELGTIKTFFLKRFGIYRKM